MSSNALYQNTSDPHLYINVSDPTVYQAAIEKSTFDGQYTRASVIVTLSIALGLYNAIEMQLLIFTTFKKWKGLYFWSLNLCNWGVVWYSLGMLLMYFEQGPLLLSKIVLDIGWVLMIVSQSLVLYSRLNLILRSARFLSIIRWYIVINSFVLTTTVVVLDFCVTYTGAPTAAKGYFYVEQIQVTCFTLQEVFLSSIYVWQTVKFLQIVAKSHTRSMIWQLMFINLVIIGLDIMLIFFQFKHLQLYQESVKGFVYSVKLKMELNILSRLVDLVHGSNNARSTALGTIDSGTIVGRAQSEIKHEKKTHDFVINWFSHEDKDQTRVKESTASQGSLDSQQMDDDIGPLDTRPADYEGVARMRSNTSFSPRLQGRESDILYGSIVRSLSVSNPTSYEIRQPSR